MHDDSTTNAAGFVIVSADKLPHPVDHYSRFPNEVRTNTALSLGARLLYASFMSYAIETNLVYPGQERLAAELGVSVRMIRIYVDELRVAGLVQTKQRGLGKTNLYLLTAFVESKRFRAVSELSQTVSDRKPVSDPDRKHISDPTYKNEKGSNYEEETARARAEPSIDRSAKKVLDDRQYERLDAYLAALAIPRSLLTDAKAAVMVKQLSDSRMPVEDITPLVRWLLSDRWYGSQPERVTIKAITDKWPSWVAQGRPERMPEPTRLGESIRGRSRAEQEQQENSDRLFAIYQAKADAAGEPYKDVAPSYWSSAERHAWEEEHSPNGYDTLRTVIEPDRQFVDVIGVVR